MVLRPKTRKLYQIHLDNRHARFVNKTYGPFLELAQKLYPQLSSKKSPLKKLTDCEPIAKLQDLYYLLINGIVYLEEGESDSDNPYLLLNLRCGP